MMETNNFMGFAGFLMALLAIVDRAVAKYQARKEEADKAEAVRQTAKDKQEFDLKMMEIQRDSEHKDAQLTEMRDDLARCREQHDASEKDRDEFRGKIAVLETQIAALAKA